MPEWVLTYRGYPPPSSKSQPIGALRLGRSSTFQPLNVPTSRRSSILVSHLPYLLPSSVSRNLLCLPLLCDFCIPNGSTGRKLPGCVTNNSHSGTHLASRVLGTLQPSKRSTCQRFFIYPHSFHTLAHSFARSKNSTLLFSGDCALFAKNHPGWGAPAALTSQGPELANSQIPVLPARPRTRLFPSNFQLSTVNLPPTRIT